MKKLFTLLTLLLGVCSGTWAAVTDLSFSATKTVTAGGEIWWTTSGTSGNVKAANDAGWCSKNENASTNKYGNITPSLSGDVTDTNPANHKVDGVLVKGGNTPSDLTTSKKALVFKVTNTTAITAYGTTTASNGTGYLRWSIYDASDNSAVVSSAYGDGASTNSTCTITKSGLSASKTYIVFIEGGFSDTSGSNQDVVVYAVKFAAPNASAPTINTQPVSASYEFGDAIAALTVSATASSGDLSYQWYKCDNMDKDNPVEKGTNSASYTPTEGGYYYCKVTDGSGNTDSNVATITVVNVFTPEISFGDPAVTITYTGSGEVYYTIDGTEPSSTNGKEYSAPFNLTNSCTVRAVAKKGENYSDEVKYNCYVDQSSAEGFLISTGNHSGSNSGSVWTSNDGNFKLSKPEGAFSWSNNIFPGMHGHKMDNGTVYTLQPTADIKITSIKIVGRTWLEGTAATVAVSGGAPASATWLAGETDHVSYILTKEFAVSANYGEAVTISPTGNQFGCFLEVYGVKRSGPADPEAVAGTTVTWDFSSSAAQTAAGAITANSSNTLKATDGTSTITYVAGSSDGYDSSNGYLKPNGKSGGTSPAFTGRYFCLNIAKSGKISFVGGSTSTKSGDYIILQGSSSTISEATELGTVANTAADCSYSIDIENGEYVFVAFSAQIYTASLSWTPSGDDITLTTSDNMAGWRAFYDASSGYTLDNNTTAYVATANDNSSVTMTALEGGVPAGTPVILKTTSSADNYKMTLTKATVNAYEGTNLLEWTTTAVDSKYRLGYGDKGVGFYPYSGTPASGAVILNTSGSAKALTFIFSDPTGISSVGANKAVSTGKRYNLSGQIVGENYKGIVIINGKKVIK